MNKTPRTQRTGKSRENSGCSRRRLWTERQVTAEGDAFFFSRVYLTLLFYTFFCGRAELSPGGTGMQRREALRVLLRLYREWAAIEAQQQQLYGLLL